MKYEQCQTCYWKLNAGCIRPKGDLCPGRLGKGGRHKKERIMKYIDADKLIAEIKRRIEWLSPATNDFAEGRRAELRSLYDFVAYLQQEQQVLPGMKERGIPGKDFIPVEWVDACEQYGRWKIIQQEQPDVDLEKASRNVYESWMGGTMDDVRQDMVELGKVLNARKV